MTNEVLRTFDMFCGGGGSSRGALMAGATPVAAMDMWDAAATTYSLNFPGATVYRMRAGSLSPHRVVSDVGPIDLILASPECTNHSVARGGRPVCDKSRDTAFEVIRFAKALKPHWLVVENVMQMQRWHRFEEWHRKLKGLGYRTNFAVLDAQFHGVPQSRKRLFVVASLLGHPALPRQEIPTAKTVETDVLNCGEPADAPWRFSPVNGPRRAEATIDRVNRAIKKLGKDTPFIMVYYGSDGAGGFQATDRTLRTVTTIDRFAYVRPGRQGHEMRMLQPPELAAAMGFPAGHKWPNISRREQIKLIGNAVCPGVMRDVVRVLVNG